MIVILKRYDLPEEHHHRAVEDLELEYFELSPDVIEQCQECTWPTGFPTYGYIV